MLEMVDLKKKLFHFLQFLEEVVLKNYILFIHESDRAIGDFCADQQELLFFVFFLPKHLAELASWPIRKSSRFCRCALFTP